MVTVRKTAAISHQLESSGSSTIVFSSKHCSQNIVGAAMLAAALLSQHTMSPLGYKLTSIVKEAPA